MYSCGYSAARNIVLNMMKEKMAWPFNVPVDPIKLGIPDYPLHIKHPMDLGTIKKKFKNYTRSSDLAADVRLTFRNALTYNQAGSDVRTLPFSSIHSACVITLASQIALFAMNLLLMFESQMEKAGVTLPPMSSELATLVEATKNARLNPPPPMALAPPPLAVCLISRRLRFLIHLYVAVSTSPQSCTAQEAQDRRHTHCCRTHPTAACACRPCCAG